MPHAARVNEWVVPAHPLSADKFGRYGEVIEHAGRDRRHVIGSAFDSDGTAPDRVLWVSRVEHAQVLPIRVTTLERHPHSAQWFSPLCCHAYLVAVCPALNDGSPDITAMEAFIARAGQGIVYGRNVWHHPMVALGQPATFVVSMAKGCPDDDVFVAIERDVSIEAATTMPA